MEYRNFLQLLYCIRQYTNTFVLCRYQVCEHTGMCEQLSHESCASACREKGCVKLLPNFTHHRAAIKLEHRHRAAIKLEQSLSLPKRTRFSSPPPGCHQTRASTATSGTRCTGWKPGTSAFATTRLQMHRCFSRKSTIASCLVLVLGAATRKSAVAATLSCTLATCQQQVRLATTLKCNRKSHETSRMGQ